MAKDVQSEAQKLYQQILDALEELTLLYAEEEEEEEGTAEDEEGATAHDIVDMVVEEATERGLDEESVEKVFKAVTALVKKAKEG